jgi:dTDP-4-amino-4,6-dideoxygalactose transaminase
VCVSNGTVALWAAVACLELAQEKPLRFCTQSFTFPASAQGYLENVMIVDIDEGGGLDLSAVPIGEIDGIIVTNVFGNIVDIDKYTAWAAANNKFLIFDNAATSATYYKGKNSCNYGVAATLSFHHTKPIGFGEGGCIIVDRQYEPALRRILNFGIDNKAVLPRWHRKGGNYKMSDIQAVYILQYLDHFLRIKSHTTGLLQHFQTKLGEIDVTLYPNFSDNTPFISCLCILSNRSTKIIKELTDAQIYCRKYYVPLEDTPIATRIYNNIVCISCTVDMTIKDIDKITSIIKSTLH